MKKIVFLFVVVLCFLITGCTKDYVEENGDKPTSSSSNDKSSGIIVRASNEELVIESTIRSADEEPIVFTGDDILWFNETTKEFRFKDNYSMKDAFSGFRSIKFYMDGAYLFSSMICINSLSSQVFNSLVFYYSITENKYFLLDGYPVINDGNLTINDWMWNRPATNETIQNIRDENRKKIESEWNNFIDLLSKEGRLKK